MRQSTFAALLLIATSAQATPIGSEIAGQVSIASYQHILEDLLYTHQGNNRAFPNGAHHNLARDNIAATLASYGLAVELDTFTHQNNPGNNVIATKVGRLYPNIQFVIGAHYDSVGNPGADDDASGVASVMELARILSQYDTAYTIKFCAWDAEEVGLRGSTSYVQKHRNESIRAMVQIDMIAHNAGTNTQDLYAGAADAPLRDALAAAFPLYGNGMSVQLNPAAGFSDHAPFSAAGYQAVCFVEDNYQSNSCYHQPCDYVERPNYIDYTFATNMVRVVGGYLADNAGVFHAGDWNNNGVADSVEIAANPSLDCNGNGLLDAFEPGFSRDCNSNGVADFCDIASGASQDADHNGYPDECRVTRLVPSQYATIQAAINAASNGDEVIVAAGTYSGTGNKDLDFAGKVLTLRSQGGPGMCTINAGGAGRCFYFHSGETLTSVVDGFTLTGGNGTGVNSSFGGGAVLCLESGPLLRNCIITGNTPASLGGGGVSLHRRSHAAFVNCTIQTNTTSGTGGGVRASLGSMPTLVNCVIARNAAGSGGGVYCIQTARPTLVNCTVSGNTAVIQGGGLFAGPTASDSSFVALVNCVIWGNTANGAGPNAYIATSTTLAAYSSDFQGGQAAVVGGGTASPWTNNIDSDPQFVDATADVYSLSAGSPVIDAGDNTRVFADFADLDADGNATEPLSRDRAGNPRFVDDPAVVDTGIGPAPIVDMGAFERQAVACAGDLNGDSQVNISDLTILLAHYGTASGATPADGDLNGDGAIGLQDLSALLSRFGTICP